jgi:uncharacterized membrane protein YcaP (DUF421 family)
MWFDSWSDLLRVAVLGGASYLVLVVALRLSGKRTLTQLSAFDFVVTVALGSTLATILLSRDVSFVEGALAFAVLIGLQMIVAFAISRWRAARRVATSAPALLVARGRFDDEALSRHRLARDDVLGAVRSQGLGDVSLVGAAVLESNGRITVVPLDSLGDGSALPFDEFPTTG